MKKFILLSIAALLTCASCNDADKGPLPSTPNAKKEIVDYGNGVYYFAKTQRDFGLSLAAFLADSTRHLISITGDGTGLYGVDNGYWVVIKK